MSLSTVLMTPAPAPDQRHVESLAAGRGAAPPIASPSIVGVRVTTL